MKMDSNTVLAIITALGILISLFFSVMTSKQSTIQLKENNKQFLFNKRLKTITVLKMLIDSFKSGGTIDNLNKESNEEDPFTKFLARYPFNYTNNTFLADIQFVIPPDIKEEVSYESRKKYFHKFSEMRKLSYEMKLIFKSKSKDLKCVSEFVFKYQEFLFLIISSFEWRKIINDQTQRDHDGETFHEAFMKNPGAVELEKKLTKLYNELLELVDKIQSNDIIETIESEMLTLH